MQPDFDSQVRALLEAKRGEWPEVSKCAKVSHSWLSKFVRGEIPNPGYETLKRVHAALTAEAESATSEKA